MKRSCNILWLTLLVFALAGCRQAVVLEPTAPGPSWDMSLEPIDVVLRIGDHYAEPESQDPFQAAHAERETLISKDAAKGLTVTRRLVTRATPDIDEVIKDLNIFMFHRERDTIVRHYYITNPNVPFSIGDVRLNNLYVGNYYFYVVANNGRSLCADHNGELGCTLKNFNMRDLTSSAISVSSGLNLMSYTHSDLKIVRAEQKFEFSLQRLTSRFDVELVNNRDISYTANEDYLSLDNYTLLNVPIRTKLFADYQPVRADMDNRTGVQFEEVADDITKRFTAITLINNMQGSVAASSSPSYFDRNALLAPPLASCMMVYAIYHPNRNAKQNISYTIYLGGPGEALNNYDVLKGKRYQYTVTFDKPDFSDPRLSSFRVFNETTKFSVGGNTSTFITGQTISRPLEVEYSTMLDNKLRITCEHTINERPNFYRYNVFTVEDGNVDPKYDTTLTYIGGSEDKPLSVLELPRSSYDETSKMAKTRLWITYTQTDAKLSYLVLSLSTTLGQIYQIIPAGDNKNYQSVTYN